MSIKTFFRDKYAGKFTNGLKLLLTAIALRYIMMGATLWIFLDKFTSPFYSDLYAIAPASVWYLSMIGIGIFIGASLAYSKPLFIRLGIVVGIVLMSVLMSIQAVSFYTNNAGGVWFAFYMLLFILTDSTLINVAYVNLEKLVKDIR